MNFEIEQREGFTLVEMLVIIGIIGILSGAMISGVGHLRRTAKRTKAQLAVNDCTVALNLYLQQEREWNERMINALEMDYESTKILARKKMLDAVVPNTANDSNSTSLDRFGLLDDWGRDQLRQNPGISGSDQKGSDGIAIEDHRIQFRLDTNYDGFVDGSEGSPNGLKIRGNVIVWSRGPDGQDDFDSTNPEAGNRYPFDDLISWEQAKVSADQ